MGARVVDHTSVLDDTSPADRLIATLRGYGRTLVAFSGGVDSSVVLAAAARALGPGGAAAVTAVSPAVPAAEIDAAAELCSRLGVAHHTVATSELDVAGYRDNGPRRCYFCKSTLLTQAVALADAEGFDVVATGTNASDIAAGFRPGIRAAAERGARTPLADLDLDKPAVRDIARAWELPTWDKPAAACLSSRIAYGVTITPARLARVERAEAALRPLLAAYGVRDLRVRDLGDTVRLEVDEPAVASVRDDQAVRSAVRSALRDAGFGDAAPVTVEPFRSGSMNELLGDPERWRHI
jgi:pyridinium-3,5-biscarboxylic acid mononucleotide sulfurtransferase